MKLSDLIRSAQYVLDNHGDCEVLIENSGFGGYEMLEVKSVKKSDMCLGEEETDNMTEEEIKVYLPDYDGTEETRYEDFTYFEIVAGSSILTT